MNKVRKNLYVGMFQNKNFKENMKFSSNVTSKCPAFKNYFQSKSVKQTHFQPANNKDCN